MHLLLQLCRIFLIMGCTAFGGPAAHIAMMEHECVQKRKWMTQEEFLAYLGITNLIPGPNSTEMAMHCGYHRAGIPGLFVAGISFILPAVTLTLGLTWLYLKTGHLPQINTMMTGIQAAVCALIFLALISLGKKQATTPRAWAIGTIAIATLLVTHSELMTLVVGGLLGLMMHLVTTRQHPLKTSAFTTLISTGAFSDPFIHHIFLTFLKIGSILYGSGYVLIAFIENQLVHTLGWLTTAQLLDAIAIGQLTPGPVLTTATTIGYMIGKTPGALAATAGIFLPSFFFVLITHPFLKYLQKKPSLNALLQGITVSALALMAHVTVKLCLPLVHAPVSLSIAAFATYLLIKKPFNIGPVTILGISAALGYALIPG